MYNKDNHKAQAREVTMTGGSGMLSIILYLDQFFYTPLSFTKEAGARITIHNPLVFPMTGEYGLNLRPNTASSIGFQQVLFSTVMKINSSKNQKYFSLAQHSKKGTAISI